MNRHKITRDNLDRLLADEALWPDHNLVDGCHNPDHCVRCLREHGIITKLDDELDEKHKAIGAWRKFAHKMENELAIRTAERDAKQRVIKYCENVARRLSRKEP